MDSRKYVLGLSIIFLVLTINLVCAASDYKVGYIYKSKTDKNIINLFKDLKLQVEMIKESSLPMDLSEYNFIFIGDENFAKDIQIEKYPTVMMNHYLVKREGLIGSTGISQLTSNQPLLVNYNKEQIKVYNDFKDRRGIALSYYYLDNENKPSSLEQFLGTYSTSSGPDFGTVSAFGNKGDVLVDGTVLEQNLCFFGITRTDYWTPDSENFFKDCIKYVFDYTVILPDVVNCSKDSDCGANKFTGSGVCTNENVFKNFITYKCSNPGETTSSCSSSTSLQLFENCAVGCYNGKCNALVCSQDTDCDDGNPATEDKCVNQGTADSICIHNIYNNITKINLVSLVAVPSLNFVTLNFSVSAGNDSVVKGYLLSRDRDKWILVLSPATGYVFSELNESTSYIFYAKAVDINGVNSEEMNISVTTLSSSPDNPAPISLGSGGGSAVGGGFSYCSIGWDCGEWSECRDGKQTRTCSVPAGKCTPENAKPIESQSCTVLEEPTTNQPSSNEEAAGRNNSDEASNSITGAAVAGALGKYSWIGVILVVLGLGTAYYFAKKFGNSKVQ